MVDDNGQPIIVSSTFQEVLATEDQPISLGTDTAVDQAFTKENDDIVSHSVGISEKSSATPVTDREVNDQIRLDRLPRSVVNSEKFTHEEKASIQEIADFVASTLDLIDDDNYKRVVLQIINAKKIRSGGLFLNMNLRIGISKCGENENSENCKKNLLDDLTKFCKVQVSINEDFKNPKVVKSHCENERRNPQKSNRTSSERHKRSLVGGKQKLSLRDPKVNQYLGEAVNYMNRKLSDGDTQLEITKVLSASSQVVSGMSYDFKVEMSNFVTKIQSTHAKILPRFAM
ncbi:hypothetical protein HHI36_002952 [Cryptolaemus montrouzieri]|uniref:Cystatin domain-containing protein n=1 Tax=Cryptolaemus montrouzieri TaxID=559131 RepID=A0ABD2PBZ8_9CUCU